MEKTIKFMKPAAGSGNELKPCPFCGSENVFFEQYEHAVGPRWRVICGGCCASIDPGYAQDPHQVTDLWNRRTAP